VTRRRRTGRSRDGLWTWTTTGDTTAATVTDNPLLRTCPHCHAGIGQQCRRPTRRGWIPCPTNTSRQHPQEAT
jgi:hypothetical protein